MGRKRKTDIDMVVEEEVKDELQMYDGPVEENPVVTKEEPEKTEVSVKTALVDEKPIDLNDPGWTDYVMDELLDKREKKDGNPTTDGLRRVANLLFNNQISYDLKVHVSTPDFASVTSYVECLGYNGRSITYTGSAECHMGNTDAPYNKYPLATAETRAEGRALKRLLNLKVLTAEETSKIANISNIEEQEGIDQSINDNQIKFIDRFCKKIDVSVQFAVDTIVGQYKSIKDLNYSQATEIHAVLNGWSNDKETIPDGHDKYDEGWRNTFC
jgi:hypothetical protein